MTEKRSSLERYISQGKKTIDEAQDIYLDRLDGYQFQQFVASIFHRLGFSNVKVGPRGADEGIDIKMEKETEMGTIRYIAECKHHAEAIIGRPTIQKLHSAVITNIMNKGIVVTSGYFSGDAIQHAESVGIELVDIDRLKELGKKVGLSIHHESRLLMDKCFPISDEASIVVSVHDFLKNDLIGFQKSLMKVEDVSLRLLSAYMVDFSINAMFNTSAGKIGETHASSYAFFNGENGQLISTDITSPFLLGTYKLSEINESQIKAKLVGKGEFTKSFKDVKENTREQLAKLYTKTVSYYGKNNVRYTKACVPSKKDITIGDARRVFLPIWSIKFSMLKNKYIIAGAEVDGRLSLLPVSLADGQRVSDFKPYPGSCMICFGKKRNRAYLCNICGRVVCEDDRYDCKVCGRVVCQHDVVKKRRFLVLKDKLCPDCAIVQAVKS